jgi:hypothetical protein
MILVGVCSEAEDIGNVNSK